MELDCAACADPDSAYHVCSVSAPVLFVELQCTVAKVKPAGQAARSLRSAAERAGLGGRPPPAKILAMHPKKSAERHPWAEVA